MKRTLKNRKAQMGEEEGQPISSIIGILLILVPLALAATFVLTMGVVGPRTISTASCFTALQARAGVHEAAEAVDGDAEWYEVWNFGEWAVGWFNGVFHGSRDFAGEALATFCRPIEYPCKGNAADVADCLYGRASDTYYTLLGGYRHGSGNEEVIASYVWFNLFRIHAHNLGAGDVELEGECSNYINTGATAAEDYECPDGLIDHDICWVESEDETTCKIMFKNVDFFTLSLPMIEKCQLRGIDDPAGRCKCFAKEEFGYSEKEDGYICKCHLCLDIRKHIIGKTEGFKELKPKEFYYFLE